MRLKTKGYIYSIVLFAIIKQINTLKILVAGELEPTGRQFFLNVAHNLASNSNHTIYIFNTTMRTYYTLPDPTYPNIKHIGFPKNPETKSDFEFKWNPLENEEEN